MSPTVTAVVNSTLPSIWGARRTPNRAADSCISLVSNGAQISLLRRRLPGFGAGGQQPTPWDGTQRRNTSHIDHKMWRGHGEDMERAWGKAAFGCRSRAEC